MVLSPDITNPIIWTKIIASLICGVAIGLERQIRKKPVGVRTSILICLGTMLYIYLGISVVTEKDEVIRILGQIVTGVGFLGAGVIMMRNDVITGMTSAAVIWLLAGIGAAIGFGFYGVAFLITFVALNVLIGVEFLEEFFEGLNNKGGH